jgi:hypothetical protein
MDAVTGMKREHRTGIARGAGLVFFDNYNPLFPERAGQLTVPYFAESRGSLRECPLNKLVQRYFYNSYMQRRKDRAVTTPAEPP